MGSQLFLQFHVDYTREGGQPAGRAVYKISYNQAGRETYATDQGEISPYYQ
jgi:hypothetical protein